jgi:hypothetical protein
VCLMPAPSQEASFALHMAVLFMTSNHRLTVWLYTIRYVYNLCHCIDFFDKFMTSISGFQS